MVVFVECRNGSSKRVNKRSISDGDMPTLQLALDLMQLNRSIVIAREAMEGGVDWIEAGTPLIKSEGAEAIRALRREFPGRKIIADTKTMDVGAFEVEIMAKAGADIVTVLGLAEDSTIDEAVKAGRKYGAEIIPVDSEHSAIFQCLMGSANRREVKKLILTCSGGPFFGMTRQQLEKVTKADALKHPNWKMGAKITIDCATLMNKGLEVIEAMRLYRMPLEKMQVVIHRQSIIHSMVEFVDGAVMAQMGTPDMRLPIQLALTYPERTECPVEPLDLLTCGSLTFSAPDLENFPCLALAMQCARLGGTACPAMNGANEEAVAMFLRDEELKPLQYSLQQIAAGGTARAGASAAVTLIIAAIPIIFFLICQSNVLETMTTSGMKE